MSTSEWEMVGGQGEGVPHYDRAGDHELILELCGRRDGLETVPGIARKCLTLYGGSDAVWRRRVHELIRGGALRREVNPHVGQRRRTLRLYVVPGVSVADAIQRALPPALPARARARGHVPPSATPATGAARPADPPPPRVRVNVHTGQPMEPERRELRRANEHHALTDAEWYALPLAARIHTDHDRAAREAKRSGTYGRSRQVQRGYRAPPPAMPQMGQPGNELRRW
jgi:hypothetical protein